MSRYNKEGWLEDLPSLKVGRSEGHGCTQYSSGGGQVRLTINMISQIDILHIFPQVLLVTGGKTETYGYLDSTELLWPGSDSVWEEISSARLPRHLSGVRITNVDNRVLLFGALSISLDLYSSSHWPVL